MRTKFRTIAVCCLMAFASTLIGGCGRGGGGGATPEEAWSNAKSAVEKKDFEAFCRCLTDESVDVMAGGLAMAGAVMKMMADGLGELAGGDQAKAQMKEVSAVVAVLEKHGITDEVLSGINPMFAINDMDALKSLVSPVKDKSAFIGEVMATIDKIGGNSGEMDQIKGELVDLKVDGDTASGFLQTDKGAEKKPVSFKKVSGSWKIDLSDILK